MVDIDTISLNAPNWSDSPDPLVGSVKRYCVAHHEGFHSYCRSCIQEAIYDRLRIITSQNETIIARLDALLLKP